MEINVFISGVKNIFSFFYKKIFPEMACSKFLYMIFEGLGAGFF